VSNNEAFLRRTKIVATLGPATDDPAVLADMLRAGLDVARINFSHGGKEEQRRRILAIRDVCTVQQIHNGKRNVRRLVELERELRATLKDADGFTRTLALWRVENTAAAVRFVDALGH